MLKIKSTLIPVIIFSITFISCSNEKETTEIIGDVATIINTVNEISEGSDEETTEENNNEQDTSEKNSSSRNEEIDHILNDYEKYINEYSKLTDVVESGDPVQLLEYASKLDKAKELNEVIQKAKEENNLSDEQISKLIQLQSQLKEIL